MFLCIDDKRLSAEVFAIGSDESLALYYLGLVPFLTDVLKYIP